MNLYVCFFSLLLLSFSTHRQTQTHTRAFTYSYKILWPLCALLYGCLFLYMCVGGSHTMYSNFYTQFQLGKYTNTHPYIAWINTHTQHSHTHLFAYMHRHSQTYRHRHHTLTFKHWQQQKYTIERNQNDAMYACICETVVNACMCRCVYLIWNLELNEMRERQGNTVKKKNFCQLKLTLFFIALYK